MGNRGSPLSAKLLTKLGARRFCIVIGRYANTDCTPKCYSDGAGARNIRSLILAYIRSYNCFPFSAEASDGRPIDPALPLGTVSQPRRYRRSCSRDIM